VTATNVHDLTAFKEVIVTKGAADTTPPQCSFSTPVPGANVNYTASSPTLSFSGSCTDNISVSTVACTYNSVSVSGLTVSAAGLSVTFSKTGLALVSGATAKDLVCTGTDTTALTGTATTHITYDTSDVSPPTVTITAPTSSATYALSSPQTILVGGTASDAGTSGLLAVTLSCDVASVGTGNSGTTWSYSVTLHEGANVCTATAVDGAGNTSTDAITITFTPPLTIQTTTLPPGTQGSAYGGASGFQFTAIGGVAPYTWAVTTGTIPAGTSFSSAGVLSGSPTTLTTYSFTVRATDASGGACPGSACTTQAESVTIGSGVLGGTNHSYFDTLRARTDKLYEYSLRDETKLTSHTSVGGWLFGGSSPANAHYLPYSDNYALPQDAAKYPIPGWMRMQEKRLDQTKKLLGSINDTVTSLVVESRQLNDKTGVYDKTSFTGLTSSMLVKIDDEIMVITASVSDGIGLQTLTVLRGRYSTLPAMHTDGADIYITFNKVDIGQQLDLDFVVPANDTNSYLLIWEELVSPSFLNLGTAPRSSVGAGNAAWPDYQLVSHKARRLLMDSGSVWLEIHNTYSGPEEANPSPAWDPNVYTHRDDIREIMATPPDVKGCGEKYCPVTAQFYQKPNKWTTYFVYLQFHNELELDQPFATIHDAINDTTGTTITFDTPQPTWSAPGSTPAGHFFNTYGTGRRVKVGTEIMSMLSCNDRSFLAVTTCTVLRGTDGSTPATHTANSQSYVTWQHVTYAVADEDRDPVVVYADLKLTTAFLKQKGTTDRWFPQALKSFRFVYDTSTDRPVEQRYRDNWAELVVYARDLVILKNPPSDWLTSIAVRPTVGGR
jgi:hypothetical protein